MLSLLSCEEDRKFHVDCFADFFLLQEKANKAQMLQDQTKNRTYELCCKRENSTLNKIEHMNYEPKQNRTCEPCYK
jgi:hypothetical protein